jgi:hypothetical protein
MSLPIRTALAAVLALAALALPALTTASPAVHAAGKCHLSRSEQRGGLGATYTVKLRVRGTSCGTGKSVAHGFNSCRKGHRARKCHPSGYNCHESRVTNSPVQRSAHVTCHKGGARVKFAYTQNK